MPKLTNYQLAVLVNIACGRDKNTDQARTYAKLTSLGLITEEHTVTRAGLLVVKSHKDSPIFALHGDKEAIEVYDWNSAKGRAVYARGKQIIDAL